MTTVRIFYLQISPHGLQNCNPGNSHSQSSSHNHTSHLHFLALSILPAFTPDHITAYCANKGTRKAKLSSILLCWAKSSPSLGLVLVGKIFINPFFLVPATILMLLSILVGNNNVAWWLLSNTLNCISDVMETKKHVWGPHIKDLAHQFSRRGEGWGWERCRALVVYFSTVWKVLSFFCNWTSTKLTQTTSEFPNCIFIVFSSDLLVPFLLKIFTSSLHRLDSSFDWLCHIIL